MRYRRARYLRGKVSQKMDVKGSINDVVKLLEAIDNGDYTNVFQSRLFNIHGDEFCEYLSAIREMPQKRM